MKTFSLVKTFSIPEIKSDAKLYRHNATNAEILSIENDDDNKVFGITFRTPPTDSTGIAHILEHSVLCGSKKYPTKEPFVELLKGSLQTFLNAFTYPDKTCYPVASQNLQDFYNLIDVYLDAVFYPRLTHHTFDQEAWHYELEKKEDPLIFKGVVFNEMKGNYSSPDSVLAEYTQESLFPDTLYGLDSGGHPRNIPDLTYEQLIAFHREYYHPSNAKIYFYGNDNPAKRLKIIETWLSSFRAQKIKSNIPLQPAFKKPRRIEKKYQGDKNAKAMITVNWLLCKTAQTIPTFSLHTLAHILIGTPASPLRKALIDSELGEDLAGVGLEGQLQQMYFSTGLKGVAAKNTDKVEKLIFKTLNKLAKDGIDPKTIEASLNTIEFRLRENNTGHYPRGLSLMVNSLTTWLYDGDPVTPIAFEKTLRKIKQNLTRDSRYFEKLIQRYLLDNRHRTTLLLKPDATVTAKEDAIEKKRLADAKRKLDLDAIIQNTKELKKHQVTPDSPEALATIPSLKLQDLDKKNKTIPLKEIKLGDAKIIYHNLFTNGIIYLDVGFDVHALPQHLIPYVSLFGNLLLEMGTEKEDFVSLSQRIGSQTGGIEPDFVTSAIREKHESAAYLFLRGKALASQTPSMLNILSDVIKKARLDNRERFKQIILEEKAELEEDLVPSGHSYVHLRLTAHLNQAAQMEEQAEGLSYLFFLRELIKKVERQWPAVLADLEEIRERLLTRQNMILNVTADAASWKKIGKSVEEFVNSISCGRGLPAPRERTRDKDVQLTKLPPIEGFTIPAQVHYVGKGFNLPIVKPGSALVINRYLRTSYLWERVRVRGGAYGGMCSFDHRAGNFCFFSYRDPNLRATLDIYDQTADYLRKLKLPKIEVTRSIIGAIGTLDTHQLPDAKGFTSLIRYLTNDTDTFRQKMREQVLSTTNQDFIAFGEALHEGIKKAAVVVIGPEKSTATLKNVRLIKVL